MTTGVESFRSAVSMQTGVAGNPEFSSLAFSSTTSDIVQFSHLIVISDIVDEGKLVKVSPLGGDSGVIKAKADAIGKSTLLGTVEVVGSEKFRFTAFSPMMAKLADENVKIAILGDDTPLGTVTIRKALEPREYAFLLKVFNANVDRFEG